jgi:hypothetical protein
VPSGGVFVAGSYNLEGLHEEFLEILRSGDLGPSRSAPVRLGEVDRVISGSVGRAVVGVSSLNSPVEGYSCMGCPRAAEVSPERVEEPRCLGCLGSTEGADSAGTPQKLRGGVSKVSRELSPPETIKNQSVSHGFGGGFWKLLSEMLELNSTGCERLCPLLGEARRQSAG